MGAETQSDDDLIQPLCAIFRRYLKRQGLKFTPERALILDAVMSRAGVFEADQLVDDLRPAPHRVSRATIYRTLRHLLDAQIISEVLLDNKHAHYEMTFGRKPKAHLVNVDDDRVIEVEAPELLALRDRISKQHGLRPVSCRFVIYGTKE